MSERPWMPLYVADYLADTGHLSAAEHGAYMLLIMHYWQNGELPQDERRLARIARLSESEWGTSRDVIADLFSEGWKHKRIDAELERATDISGKRKAAALQRHSKRDAIAPANAELMQTQSQSHTQEEEKPKPTVSSKKRGVRIPDDFVPDKTWAVTQGLPMQRAEIEAAKFRDYWSSKGGDATKTDWDATWRNWVRSALERLPQARGSPINPIIEASRLLRAEMDAANADPASQTETDRTPALRLSYGR